MRLALAALAAALTTLTGCGVTYCDQLEAEVCSCKDADVKATCDAVVKANDEANKGSDFVRAENEGSCKLQLVEAEKSCR